MARHFPIFIDLGSAPPLVVGAQSGLLAKLRLLAVFAPRIDLITGLDSLPAGFGLAGVCHMDGIAVDRAAAWFMGRPLIVINTGDLAVDEALSRQARKIGVPVNVPDKPALCSFYLGSIVDRDPVILAISTGGHAPVLAQRIRAGIEDWLPSGYGRLAIYLNRIRQRLRHLPAACRRRLQHRIIDGEASRWIIDGDEARVDSQVVRMLADPATRAGGGLHVIQANCGDPGLLNRHEIEAIRNADVILCPPSETPALVHLARREVEMVTAEPAMARAYAASMSARGLQVVIINAAVSVRPAAGRSA